MFSSFWKIHSRTFHNAPLDFIEIVITSHFSSPDCSVGSLSVLWLDWLWVCLAYFLIKRTSSFSFITVIFSYVYVYSLNFPNISWIKLQSLNVFYSYWPSSQSLQLLQDSLTISSPLHVLCSNLLNPFSASGMCTSMGSSLEHGQKAR